jgi:hypothetical protein
MAGPWEDFAQQEAGPWTEFAPRSSLDGVDIAKSGGIGLAKGAIGVAGMGGDIGSLIGSGVDWAGGKLGLDADKLKSAKDSVSGAAKYIPGVSVLTGPGSQQIQKQVEGYTGEFYKPQTMIGEGAQTLGEFAPAALLGPASLGRRVGMQVAVPALGSETAGQLTKGKDSEPYARIVGALAAPVAAAKAGPALAEAIGGLGTHTGGQSVRTAFTSGAKGGEAGKAFRDNMRGNVPLDDVVTDARTAVGNMRADRSRAYEAGMTGVRSDQAVLKFDDIEDALRKSSSVGNFKGKDLSPETASVRNKIAEAIHDWKSSNPKEFHTPAGMDALKQRIGSIKDDQPFHTRQRLIADKAYNAVRETIVKQAPEYAKTMKGYEQATTQIGEIEKALLGKKGSSTDTALRKLTSVTRNNVNTNYGKRADLAKELTKSGAPNLMEALSGQAMNAWTPRGLGKVGAPLIAGAGFLNPMALSLLPATSPRIVGEAAHMAGRAAGVVPKAEAAARALLGIKPSGKISKKQAALISALNAEQSAAQ